MGRRLGLVVLVVAVVVGARLIARRAVDVDLHLQFGTRAATLRDVTLVFTVEGGGVARELRLFYPDGAPAVADRRVRLVPGVYDVGARLTPATGPPATLSRALRVDDAGVYPLALDDGL